MSLKDSSINSSYDTGAIDVDVVRDFFELCLDDAMHVQAGIDQLVRIINK